LSQFVLSTNDSYAVFSASNYELIDTYDECSYVEDISSKLDLCTDGKKLFTTNKSRYPNLDSINEKIQDSNAIEFSPDGSKVLVTVNDAQLDIWDVESGEFIRNLSNECISKREKIFTPDGEKIIMRFCNENIQWDIQSGQIQKLSDDAYIAGESIISNDGKVMVSVQVYKHNNSFRITAYNFETNERVIYENAFAEYTMLTDMLIVPKRNKLVITFSDGSIRIYTINGIDTNNQFASPDVDDSPPQEVANAEDNTLLPGIKYITQYSSSDVTSLAWSPDGNMVATGTRGGKIFLMESETGEMISQLSGHNGEVSSLSWHPNGELFASGGEEYINIWKTSTGERLQTRKTGYVRDLEWSPQGDLLAGINYLDVILYDPGNEDYLVTTLSGHSCSVFSLAWSPDGSKIASGACDDSIYLWNSGTGEVIHTLEVHVDRISSLDWSLDGKTIASGLSDGKIILWDTESGELIRLFDRHTSDVSSISWSPDGNSLASASFDGSVILWDINEGVHEYNLDGNSESIFSITWSPDRNFWRVDMLMEK